MIAQSKRWLPLLLATSLTALTSAAFANVVTVTYYGTVSQAYLGITPVASDPTGLFGGGSISGDSVISVYTYQLTPNLVRHFPNEIDQGGYGKNDPVLTASITINGHTVAIPQTIGSAFPSGSQYSGFFDAESGFGYSLSHGVFTGIFADVVLTNFPNGGYFAEDYRDPYYGQTISPDIDFANYKVVVSGAVPETSTWAMMLLGFGGLGFLAYSKTLKNNAGAAMLAAYSMRKTRSGAAHGRLRSNCS